MSDRYAFVDESYIVATRHYLLAAVVVREDMLDDVRASVRAVRRRRRDAFHWHGEFDRSRTAMLELIAATSDLQIVVVSRPVPPRRHPLYKIRGLLRHGVEHLSERQVARLETALDVGDPDWEVTIAWGCYQRLRSIYHQPTAAAGKKIAEDVIATLHTCPIPEVARLGRTLRAWRTQVLAHFDTDGVSNGGTEAINLIIEKTRRLAHGFRTFAHYRMLLVAGGLLLPPDLR